MPVIRLAGSGGGFFGGAGQAAGAYDNATAEGRRATHARERVAKDGLERARRADLERLSRAQQQGAQAQQRDFQNKATTRRLSLREREIGARQDRYEVQSAVKASNGLPINGASVIQMVTRLSELDRDAYEQLVPTLEALGGGAFGPDSPATPAGLDQHPSLNQIYAAIAPHYASAVKADDEAAVERGFEETVASFIDDPRLLESDKEWSAWHQQLADGFARAERSPGGATMAMMGPLYRAAQSEGARIATVKQQRQGYLQKFEAFVGANTVDADKLQSAKLRMATMGSSQNPQQVYAEAMVRIDPDFALAHSMGQQAGYSAGAVGAAQAQVAAQPAPFPESGRQVADDGEVDGMTGETISTPPPKPGHVNYADDTALIDAIEGPSDASTIDREFAAFLVQRGIKPTDGDAVLSASEVFMRARKKHAVELKKTKTAPLREQSRAQFFRG